MTTVFQSPIIQGATSQGGGGQDPSQLVETLMRIKQFKMQEEQQKKQDAAQKFEMGMKLSDQGIFAPQLFEDLFREFKLDPKKVHSTAELTTPAGGAQSASQPSAEAGKKAPGGGVDQGGLGQGQGGLLEAIQQRTMAKGQELKVSREQATMMGEMNTHSLKQMHDAVLANDPVKAGQAASILMLTGGLKYEETPYIVGQMKGDQRDNWVKVKAGMETPEDLAKRKDDMIRSLSTTYRDSLTPSEIQSAADAMVEGKPLDPSLSSKVNNLQTMGRAAELYAKFSQQVPGNIARRMAQVGAVGGDPMSALPAGQKTFSELQMMEEHRRTGLQAEQLEQRKKEFEFEKDKFSKENARIQASAELLKDEQLTKEMTALATLKRSGIKGDQYDALEKQMLNRIARASGMKIGEVSHWWGTVEHVLVPDEGDDVVKAAAGAQAPSGTQERGIVKDTTDILQEIRDHLMESMQEEDRKKQQKKASSPKEPV